MRTKMRVALMVLLVCGLSIPASATIVQMAEHIQDPGFDNTDITTEPGTGLSPDTYYHGVPASGFSGWMSSPEGNAWIFQTLDGVDLEDTPEQMGVMQLSDGQIDTRMWTNVNTALVDGDTYQVSFKTRTCVLPNDPVWGTLNLDVSIGYYDGTLSYTTAVPTATNSWESFSYSFTYNQADHAPDAQWAIVFRVTNPPAGGTGRVVIDSLSSIPEPSAMALLVSGLIGLLAYAWRRRR